MLDRFVCQMKAAGHVIHWLPAFFAFSLASCLAALGSNTPALVAHVSKVEG